MLEFFFDSKLTLKDVPEEKDTEAAKTEAEDQVNYLGLEAMQLFDQDEDVLTLEDEEATEEELTTMITPVDGITSSQVFDDPNSVVTKEINFKRFSCISTYGNEPIGAYFQFQFQPL